MATLNIKNLPDALYEKLKVRARQDRRSIAQEATQLLAAALDEPNLLSIMELRGLGKELWHGIDPEDHVATERASWD
jgi:plasmid stability protein